MYLQAALWILVSYIALVTPAAVHVPSVSGQRDSLIINESANITDMEALMRIVPAAEVQSRGPHCVDSMGTPPLSSCMEALELLPRDRRQVTFGQRRLVGMVDHVTPYDLISCKSSTLQSSLLDTDPHSDIWHRKRYHR